MKIGIYGGSFNPIHNGHIRLAEEFLRQARLDEVWFMVSPQNPFKINDKLLDDNLRLELVAKALENKKQMVACDYEFHLPKPSYTWNTLQSLSKDFSSHDFTLLIGGDNWKSFNRWYHAEDILASYQIVIYPRNNDEIEKNSTTNPPKNVSFLNVPLINISSTEVRQRVEKDKTIERLVPDCIKEDVVKYYKELTILHQK
ncbi:nicotinate (nicotinamide) nucleotide adenylyltransferase [Prevotella disiens]|uniref:Probable nicotinate-nucleotide adenylyltransferase n=1 Tax=Prevotella disiens DNF00882 TaxID=1401075 RepID=A0A096BVB3_9BACT|nr:nicotinate (nicotinamide) nucleotide adenylyltransferase [Prevotella disiens]KGF46672.1 nicotinate-nucleotide adenylyltransferase [Prevotella disiens DNF00882]